jgi:hypothetical protein
MIMAVALATIITALDRTNDEHSAIVIDPEQFRGVALRKRESVQPLHCLRPVLQLEFLELHLQLSVWQLIDDEWIALTESFRSWLFGERQRY